VNKNCRLTLDKAKPNGNRTLIGTDATDLRGFFQAVILTPKEFHDVDPDPR
jgi:hypothetical protein